jgi:RimJ/RimL family protein N-acetyltransferase
MHLCGIVAQWPLRRYGQFAVVETASDTLVGWAGLWHPIQFEEPELAWSLFSNAQGKGFATEAATCAMRWAADDLGLAPLYSLVHPDNTPSRKLAERLGSTLEGSNEFYGQPRLFYRHRNLQTTNSDQANQLEKDLTCQS